MSYDTFSKPYGEMFRKGGLSNDYDFQLLDDTATKIEAKYVGELVFMWTNEGDHAVSFLGSPNGGASSASELCSSSSATVLSGQALTGDDGADGDITLSSYGDGHYYIENRSGATANFHVRILS